MPSSALAKRTPDYTRLTRAEIASIVALNRAGKTQTEIALALGCNHSTVSRWLTELEDTTELAKHKLRSAAADLVDRVVRDADVDQSLEVLDRIGVAEKRQTQSGPSAFQINIGMPGAPAGPDPVNVISNYQTRTEHVALTGQQVTDTIQIGIEAKVEGESRHG